jgi:superfamily II DNA/RNA helicase
VVEPPPFLSVCFVYNGRCSSVDDLDMILSHVTSEKSMIFCNTLETCQNVYNHLQKKGLSSCILHGSLKDHERQQVWKEFQANKDLRLLVCTDIASRGLDSLMVDHVILYDFPHSAVDYLHRVGRTARKGMTGRVTSLVTRRDRPLAMTIQVRFHLYRTFLGA